MPLEMEPHKEKYESSQEMVETNENAMVGAH